MVDGTPARQVQALVVSDSAVCLLEPRPDVLQRDDLNVADVSAFGLFLGILAERPLVELRDV